MNQYLGEIRMFGGDTPPEYWALCDGQLLQISDYPALFDIIGTTYGGDGTSNFALPDLRGRVPVHPGFGQSIAELGGTETVKLSIPEMPQHSHEFRVASKGGSDLPLQNLLANAGGDIYTSDFWRVNLSKQAVSSTGGDQPHDNMQPYLCINFIIAVVGDYVN